MEYFELQPLRIPSGWMVQYNNFSEYDLEKHGEKYRFELVEDLLQLKNHNLLIDLGWYPSMDSAGEYVLYFVDAKKVGFKVIPHEHCGFGMRKIINKSAMF